MSATGQPTLPFPLTGVEAVLLLGWLTGDRLPGSRWMLTDAEADRVGIAWDFLLRYRQPGVPPYAILRIGLGQGGRAASLLAWMESTPAWFEHVPFAFDALVDQVALPILNRELLQWYEERRLLPLPITVFQKNVAALLCDRRSTAERGLLPQAFGPFLVRHGLCPSGTDFQESHGDVWLDRLVEIKDARLLGVERAALFLWFHRELHFFAGVLQWDSRAFYEGARATCLAALEKATHVRFL